MEVSVIDIESSCRACLQTATELEPLFETLFEDSPLSKVLIQINPNLTIEKGDKLSRFICDACRDSAINAYRFQQMCESNDKRIRTLIESQIKFEIDNTIKTEEGGEISQDGLSLIGKIEAQLQSDSNDVMLTELKPLSDEYESEQDGSNDDSDEETSSDSEEDAAKSSNYNCDSCNTNFSSDRKLERHLRNVHQVRKSKSVGSEDIDSSSGDEDETMKIFTCDSCPKKFKKPSLLARHIKTHDPNKRPHECAKCQKRFPSQVALVRHDILHSELVERSKINRPDPQDFSCVVCGRTFKSPESLNSHLKTHKNKSPENQEYTCKLCHDVFPTFTDITRHSKNHIENATHQCAICNKLFVIGDELIDHFLRHKGMKPHQCPVCEKSFLKLHKLNVHMRIHSDDKVTKILLMRIQ